MTDKSLLFRRLSERYIFPDETMTILHPTEDFNMLIEALRPMSEMLQLTKGKRLDMKHNGEKVCYLLLDGYYSYRYHRSGTIISNFYPPIIAGLRDLFSAESLGYIRAETSSTIYRVSYSSLLTCLDQRQELWICIAKILVYISDRLFLRDYQINTKNAYQAVCYLLQDLLRQPDEVRRHQTAANYILDRTQLSRSNVMAILSKLRSGNYIEVKPGGYLLAVNHLPKQSGEA